MATSLVFKKHGSRHSLQRIGIWYFIVITTLTAGESCGQPALCQCPPTILHEIECVDPNMTDFPLFYEFESSGVLQVIIHNTSVTELPLFQREEWTSLRVIDVRNNSALSCEKVSRLYRPGLTIISSCNLTNTEGITPASCVMAPPPGSTQTLPLVVTLPPLMLTLFVGSILAYRKRKHPGGYHVTTPLELESQYIKPCT